MTRVQGKQEEESCQLSLPHLRAPYSLTGSDFQATFLFHPTPTLCVKQGRARPGQWVGLAGCHALPQGCLPTWLVCTWGCQAAESPHSFRIPPS